METLLVFLAIAAIQMIAAYSKQKKEAAKKAEKQHIPPQEASPIPDPFKEIREAMGLPPVIKEVPEPELKLEPEPEPILPYEGFALNRLPFQAITDRKTEVNSETAHDSEIQASKKNPKLNIHRVININNPVHGILWTAILQEARYKAKWKPKCYR